MTFGLETANKDRGDENAGGINGIMDNTLSF